MQHPNWIRHFREEQGWSQRELAERVGTTNQQVSMLERGERRLSWDWRRRLANALGCHPDDLLDGPATPARTRERELVDAYRQLGEEGDQLRAVRLIRALKESPSA